MCGVLDLRRCWFKKVGAREVSFRRMRTYLCSETVFLDQILLMAAVSLVHTLDEVGGSEEHAAKSLFDLLIRDADALVEDQDLVVFPDSSLALAPPHNQVVIHKNDIDFPAECPIL